jgi:DeoR/GlpR family transcriptional regulator of sugar metabolism
MWGVSIKRTHPVEDIAAMFGVSIPTIIRDLEQSQVRLSERLTQTLARAQARTHHHTS